MLVHRSPHSFTNSANMQILWTPKRPKSTEELARQVLSCEPSKLDETRKLEYNRRFDTWQAAVITRQVSRCVSAASQFCISNVFFPAPRRTAGLRNGGAVDRERVSILRGIELLLIIFRGASRRRESRAELTGEKSLWIFFFIKLWRFSWPFFFRPSSGPFAPYAPFALFAPFSVPSPFLLRGPEYTRSGP